MSASRATEPAEISAPALGMLLFISSELMFFGGLFAAYFTIRGRADVWPPEGTHLDLVLPLIGTVLLVSSSVTMHLATARLERSGVAGPWLPLTIGMGAGFLAIQAIEYAQLGFSVSDHAFGTLFYSLTGFHGLHVFGGLVTLVLMWIRIGRGQLDAERPGGLIAAGYYWHFVDVVWLLLFATLYILR
ncbi:MAG: heme-copper oxidase subunit III [Actinomycetota bacterium]